MSCCQDVSGSDNAASAWIVCVFVIYYQEALPRPRVPDRFATTDDARQRNRRLNSRLAARQASWWHYKYSEINKINVQERQIKRIEHFKVSR